MDERGDPQAAPTLTTETPRRERVPGQAGVVNGTINVRKTHPNLYWMVMGDAITFLFLGANFWILKPTFLVYDTPNGVWGTAFLVLGLSTIVFLNVYRSLTLLRLSMAAAVGYLLLIGLGTTEPFLAGAGSLQLPILYLAMAVTTFAMLIEPFINPWTARRD